MFASMFVVCRFQYFRLILSKQTTILARISSRVEWECKFINLSLEIIFVLANLFVIIVIGQIIFVYEY
jgi:hypothetical protein